MTFAEDAVSSLSNLELYSGTYTSSETRKPSRDTGVICRVVTLAKNDGAFVERLERKNNDKELPPAATDPTLQEVVVDFAGHQQSCSNPDAHLVDDGNAPDTADHPMTLHDRAASQRAPDHPPSEVGITAKLVLDVAQLQGIENPQDNDVLCVRGNPAKNHKGNRSYLDQVEERKPAYSKAKGQTAKRLVARRIVDLVRSRQPPGRFLKQDPKTRLWNDIGDDKAFAKVDQALREKPTAAGHERSAGIKQPPRPAQVALNQVR
jgi:hypothetical protein